MASVGDPVASGLVKSLARPGGNITGLSNLALDYSTKQLELLISIVPKLTSVAVLVNPTNTSHPVIVQTLRAPAEKAGVEIVPVEARTAQEIDAAFSAVIRQRASAIIVMRDALFNNKHLPQIVGLAMKHRLPSMGGISEYAETGGLASYGTNLRANFRRAATYVDKIFKGAKPGELPVEQPTTVELLINVKTAKALGMALPSTVLARADRLID
jgi:putative ABC transport system substrate-binding protein